MILSYTELLGLLDAGVITGAKPASVNAASIDVHLGGEFLSECVAAMGLCEIDLAAREPLKVSRLVVKEGATTFLDPGEFVLAHTVEMFNLPDDISAKFVLKSSIARAGLNQLSAVWCDAGWHNSRLTLELSNVTQHHRLTLTAGMPIGQMVFYRHAMVPAEQSYRARGRYNNSQTVEGVLP